MAEPRVWLVSGATGLVGGRLLASLLHDDAVVRGLTRDLRAASGRLDPRVIPMRWDGAQVPVDAVNGVDVVVHLAGEPVFGGRLSAGRRRLVYGSRVHPTRSLVKAIGALPPNDRPRALVCASAVGYYGSRGEERLPESAASGDGFLAEVCRDWEEAARGAEEHGVRVVTLRIGIVLAHEGGALPMMTLPFRFGLGGRLGDGRQWVPWIHADDLVEMIRTAARDDAWRGAVNAVAPTPVRNSDLTRSLAHKLGRPSLLPAPAFALRAALGELAEELLGSRQVVPQLAQDHGFSFRHPTLDSALSSELSAE